MRYTLILFLAGVGMMLIGFGYDIMNAGIPYQDASIELQEAYEAHSQIAQAIGGLGFIFFVASIASHFVFHPINAKLPTKARKKK